MVNKHVACRRLSFEPQYPLLFVSDEDITEIPAEAVTAELVGKKAFGLSCLPKSWTLPFIVISDKLLPLFHCCRENDRETLLGRWTPRIMDAAFSMVLEDETPIIVRSSGYSEGLEERGKFYSYDGILKTLLQPLTHCLQRLASDTDLNKQKIPLVIQKYTMPISAKGHLSNERRFYKEKRDWLGEFEEIPTVKSKAAFQINLRNWRKKIIVGNRTAAPLECNLSAHVSEVLKIPATWAYERKLRLHFEWVWDGRAIYLVQADQEHEADGVNPTFIHQGKLDLSSGFEPKCLKKVNESHASRYNKIHNVFTYMKLGLPITQLYVLDDQSVIDELAIGHVSKDLEDDIFEMVKKSLVIRMDLATDDTDKRLLLPRTEVREFDSALAWLKEQSAEIKRRGIQDDLVFIFHNFVPSVSSAFAYAAPKERKVQIEALWGLPEGLYYNAHDKYIVDTQTPRGKELRDDDISRFEVQEKLCFKHFFVTPDQNGRWTTQILKRPYDWRQSIPHPEWVKKIALESRRIAEEEGKPLSIMWFVGVPKEVCDSPIFPWYHEPFDPKITSRALTHRTKTPFDKSLVIRTTEDLEVLRQEAKKAHSIVRRVRIQPREEMLLRDKETLRMIGELTQKIDAVILLEGGVLSHAYYQLMETNAVVEVLHPFGDFEDKQELNKLVRDKVPSNIEIGGEVVSKTHLSGEFLLRALREKLVEEAFEVMDATDQDSIIGELTDVSEIIDGILSQLGVRRAELQQRQEQKREKAGGFKDGIVLLKTRNPLPTKKESNTRGALFNDVGLTDTGESGPIDDREIIELSHKIDKRSDRREHQAATEVILRLVIPMVRDSWTASTPETVIDSDSGDTILAKIIGTRLSSKLRIELSIFNKHKQLKLL